MKAKRRLLRVLMWLSIGGIAVLLGRSCHRSFNPAYTPYQTSDSPDGRFRCVVEHRDPPGINHSPHMYRFTIVNGASGTPFPGEPFVHDNDSCVLNPVTYQWDANSLIVLGREDPNYVLVRCRIRGGTQYWSE